MVVKALARSGRYSSGKVVYAGKWCIGSVDWDGGCPPEGKHYKVTCRLPGLKEVLGHVTTEQEGIDKLQKCIIYWVEGLEIEKDDK